MVVLPLRLGRNLRQPEGLDKHLELRSIHELIDCDRLWHETWLAEFLQFMDVKCALARMPQNEKLPCFELSALQLRHAGCSSSSGSGKNCCKRHRDMATRFDGMRHDEDGTMRKELSVSECFKASSLCYKCQCLRMPYPSIHLEDAKVEDECMVNLTRLARLSHLFHTLRWNNPQKHNAGP